MFKISENIINQDIDSSIILTRIFEVPCDLVFKAWTEPVYIRKWWSGNIFGRPESKTEDLSKDKKNNNRFSEGKSHWSKITYNAMEIPLWIICIDSFSDGTSNTVSYEECMRSSDLADKPLVTVILTEHSRKTWLMLQQSKIETNHERDRLYQSWNKSLDKLADYIAKDEKDRNIKLFNYIISLTKGINL